MASLNHRRHAAWFAVTALVLTACGSTRASTAHQVAVRNTDPPVASSTHAATSARASASSALTTASPVATAKPATTVRHLVPATTTAAKPKLAVAPTRSVAPKPTAAAKPKAAAGLCGAPANPFGYNFCGGQVITTPDPAVCNYFSCIPNFSNGKGYLEQCRDGMYSMSGGRSGACSYHGGENQPVLKG